MRKLNLINTILEALFKQSRNGKFIFLKIISLSLLGSGLMMLSAYLLVRFFSLFFLENIISGLQFNFQNIDLEFDRLETFSVFIIFIYISSLSINFYSNFIREKLLYSLVEKYSKQILSSFFEIDIRSINLQNSGEMSKRILSDSNQVGYTFFGSIIDFTIGFLNISIFLLIILYIDRVLFLIVSPILFFIIISITIISTSRIKSIGRKINKTTQVRFNEINEILINLKLIKLYEVGDYFVKKFEKATSIFVDFSLSSFLVTETSKFVFESIYLLLIVGIPTLLVLLNLDLSLIVPKLTFVFAVVIKMMPIFQRFSTSINKILLSSNVIESYSNIFNKDFSKNHTNKKSLRFSQSINIKNIVYKHPERESYTLKRISFEIRKFDIIAIIGHSGSGKTTFLNILLGLNKVQEGNIIVDGKDSSLLDPIIYRSLFSYIAQETFIFNSSILFNITLKDEINDFESIKLEKIKMVLNFDDWLLKDFSLGLETIVGERGIQLSGGQRQRIGIARALFRDADILVFDEATNALDYENEKSLINNILGNYQDKTFVIVTHRQNNLDFANRIIEIRDGNILEKRTLSND